MRRIAAVCSLFAFAIVVIVHYVQVPSFESIKVRSSDTIYTIRPVKLVSPLVYSKDDSPAVRAEKLWQSCQKLGLTMPGEPEVRKWPTTALLLSEKYKLITCSVFKDGSTHWRKIYQVLQGFHSNMNFSFTDITLKDVKNLEEEEERINALHSFTKIAVFRDPLERLISFYRDKLVMNCSWGRSSMYILGKKICSRYNTKPIHKKCNGEIYTAYEPTFKDLAKYILLPNVHDLLPYWEPMHWDNFTRCCHPCEVHYTHVVDMNQMTEEANEIFENLNIPKTIRFPKAYTSHISNSKKELFDHYYSSLSPELYQRVCDYYETDYKMFGLECPRYPGPLVDS